ncbi:E3 ubiquitin-protein ligase-like [Takifugu flavidus]|uniref:E3 ubiquitin-protein ligase-like n=1 Tax=Takifugu flavidus TaxID=433684 RepID=UPI00254446EE|nr:E3 ubiquitin-protein ligase-like [Takifugu flavidus]
MCSDLECGVCYRTFNAGRRCPRELRCHHSFCESCLLLLSRTQGSEEGPRSITCPLCRNTTSISAEARVRAELRVDEAVLERLVAAGVLDREEEEAEEEEMKAAEEERARPDTPAEESAPFPDSRGARLRRSWKKVWRKINGDQEDPLTSTDLSTLTMMSCLMF